MGAPASIMGMLERPLKSETSRGLPLLRIKLEPWTVRLVGQVGMGVYSTLIDRCILCTNVNLTLLSAWH